MQVKVFGLIYLKLRVKQSWKFGRFFELMVDVVFRYMIVIILNGEDACILNAY